jgi:hypothetical protein
MSVIRKELGAFAALAALPAAMSAGAPATAAPVANQCSTRLLSAAEMQAGVQSEVNCYRTQAEMLAASGIRGGFRSPLADSLLATHNTIGAGSLSVYGGTCGGGGVNLSAPYNDAITSTTHGVCGRIKHFADANANGDYQITSGSYGTTVTMNGTMTRRTSSIYYYSS